MKRLTKKRDYGFSGYINNRYLEKKYHTLEAAIKYHKKMNPHRKLFNYPVKGQCYIEKVLVDDNRTCLYKEERLD